MTPEEVAGLQGHVTGEIQYLDQRDIYDDPVEGRSIILWLAAVVLGLMIVGGVLLKVW